MRESRCLELLRLPIVSLLALTLASCSSLYSKSYEPQKPVELNHRFFGSPLKQDGASIDPLQAARSFAKQPEAKPYTDKYFYYNGGGFILDILGLAVFLDGLHNGRSQNVLIGIAAIGAGLGADYLGHRALKEAVEIHNRGVSNGPTGKIGLRPFLNVVQSGVKTGLQLEF